MDQEDYYKTHMKTFIEETIVGAKTLVQSLDSMVVNGDDMGKKILEATKKLAKLQQERIELMLEKYNEAYPNEETHT